MATDIAWVLNNNPKYDGCAWFLTDDKSLENLNWGSTKDENDNSIPKPTQEELDEYFNANQTAYNNAINVSNRKYPSIQDQLDMMYHDQVDGTTTWKDAIAQVKADNPKSGG